MLNSVVRDIRFALRSLGRRPWFALTVTLMLAVGIGANTAIFSVVDAVLLRPIPVPESDRMVVAWGKHPQIGREVASLPDYLDWKAQAKTLSEMTAVASTEMNITPPGGEAESVAGSSVMTDFFDVMRVPVARGRPFRKEDGTFGAHRVVVLSDAFWGERFGRDPSIVGRTVPMNGYEYQVIGIAAPDFRFPEQSKLWVPYAFDPARGMPGRRADFLLVVGRLAPGAAQQAAQQEMSTIASRLAQQYPRSNENWSVELVGLQDQIVSGSRTSILIFMSAVGLVLLIVCANVANLLLSRAATRDREMSIRASLGASRARLFRQALVESVVLALAGGALGILLATWGTAILPRLLPPDVPRTSEITLSGRVLFFAMLASIGTGLLFGVAPALRLSSGAGGLPLHEGTRGVSGTRGAARLRGALVTAQVALAMVNLLGCGLLVRSFVKLQEVELGFATERVITFQVPLPSGRYRDRTLAASLFESLGERLRAIPSVTRVGMTSDLPLGATYDMAALAIEGRPSVDPQAIDDAMLMTADTGYFGAIGLPLVRGRVFNADDRRESPPVTVVTRAFERRFFNGESAIGHRVTLGNPTDSSARWYSIIGVVGDVRRAKIGGELRAGMFLAATQDPQLRYFVVLRTTGDPKSVLAAVRREVQALEPGAPVADVATMDERLDRSLAQPRLTVVLATIFSSLALVLAVSGLYAVVAYGVAQRTRELGIRLALGATRGEIVRQVLRQGMTPTLAGLVIGGVVAAAAARAMESLLYGVTSTDPMTFLIVPVLLSGVALLACYFPARAATRVDPVTSLRTE